VFLFKINLQRVPVVMFLITAAFSHECLHPSGHIVKVAVLRDNKRDILDFVKYL